MAGTLGLMYSFLVSIPICIYTQGESGGELTASLVCRAYRKQCSMFPTAGTWSTASILYHLNNENAVGAKVEFLTLWE